MDQLRGLAVVLMLFANLAPYLAPVPPPLWYRALATFCAPGFVLLAGLMVGLHAPRFPASLGRGIQLVAVGALLDVVAWRMAPLRSFDVLYLIGVSLPILALAARLSPWITLTMAGLVFAFTPIAQEAWGYGASFTGTAAVLHAALLGGWFPLLPWIAVGLLGVALGTAQAADRRSGAGRSALWGAALAVAGAVAWRASDTPLATRGGYAELFYPPTFAVLGTFSGLALLLLAAMKAWSASALPSLTRVGRHSLLAYGLHVLLIAYVIAPLAPGRGWWATLLGLAFLLAALALALHVRARISSRRPGREGRWPARRN